MDTIFIKITVTFCFFNLFEFSPYLLRSVFVFVSVLNSISLCLLCWLIRILIFTWYYDVLIFDEINFCYGFVFVFNKGLTWQILNSKYRDWRWLAIFSLLFFQKVYYPLMLRLVAWKLFGVNKVAGSFDTTEISWN